MGIADPHLKADDSYDVFREASRRGHLVQRPGGAAPFVGDCWPGRSVLLATYYLLPITQSSTSSA